MKGQTIALLLTIILMGIFAVFTIKMRGDLDERETTIKVLHEENEKLNTEIDRLIAEHQSLNNDINLLVEDNNSLTIEIETLREENAKLEIAAETIQKEMNKVIESVPYNNYSIIHMTDSERDLLAKILALEAGDQPDVGQRAVVEVVFNRVLTGWASTVEGVIYDKGQFSTVKYLNNPYQTPDEQEYANIDWVLEHGSTILPSDYVYFATYKANGTDFIQIGEHYFGRSK